MRVLVTGATGFLGSSIVAEAIGAGHEVRVLVRTTSNLDYLAGLDVERAFGELRDPDSLQAAVEGVEGVIHSGGLINAPSEDGYMAVNRDGTRSLAEIAARRDVRRFVYVSSLAAGGPSLDGQPVTEDMAPRPVTPYGRSKLAGESAAFDAGGVRMAVSAIRPPVIYGPRDYGTLPFYKIARLGLAVRVGRRDRFADMTYVSDVARACVIALKPEAAGRVYYVPGREAYSWFGFQEIVGRALGKARLTHLSVPEFALHVAGAIGELSLKLGVKGALDRHKVVEMLQPAWVSSGARIAQDLGHTPQVSAEVGVARAVEWYRAHQWI